MHSQVVTGLRPAQPRRALTTRSHFKQLSDGDNWGVSDNRVSGDLEREILGDVCSVQ